MDLPLVCVDDSIQDHSSDIMDNQIEPGPVYVACSLGAYAHNEDFTSKQALPYGTELTFTGKTTEKNGLIYYECAVWIAVDDGETQILLPKN